MTAQNQRPRFYEGQYLGADDVAAVVEYGHVQGARHELGAHTWGIHVGLTLVERDTAGAAKQKLVFLTPGLAEDGFGRKLLAFTTSRLPEALFSGISYDSTVDDPTLNGGVAPGRFVKVWLAYDEQAGQAAAPGFADCDSGDTYARVLETYRFVVGDPTALTDLRSPITVAARTMDAAQALRTFDPAAPVLNDASIPHQQFPETTQGVRWLVPVGVVRWVVGASGGGYFVDRDLVASDKGTERIRRFMRTYAGAVAETVGASDGALVLRSRAADPTVKGCFQERLQSAEPLANILNDLVWVEGNLRVVGDARLAAGAVRWVDISGHDGGTPLSMERLGDQNAAAGKRSLDALIGPDAQPDNRFAVATVVTDDPNPLVRTLSEKLTVLSSGNVGVGIAAPAYRLHVSGDRIRLQSPDASKIMDLRTDAADVSLESTTNNIAVHTSGGPPSHHLLLNPDDADGYVAVGTATPNYKLDVKSKTGIKLGLEGNGGGQLVLANNAGDNMIYLEGFDQAGTGTAAEMLITGRNTANLPRLSFNANVTYASNQLGVGTNTPAGAVHVVGDQILLENAARNKRVSLFTYGSDVDLYTDTHRLSLRSANGRACIINWIAGDGNVGIGTGVPTQKLHVGGPFLLVDGAGGERAYLGGDGVANDVQIGSMNAGVPTVTCWNTGTSSGMKIAATGLTTISDQALKKDIRPIEGALDTLQQLRGVRFKWRSHPGEAKDELGVIAQEVAAVLPEAADRIHGHAAVSMNSLVSVLIEAVKELATRQAALEKELAALKKASHAAGGRARNHKKPDES